MKFPDPRKADFEYLQPTYALHDTEGQLKALQDDGFALIPGAISREQVAEIRSEIDRLQAFGFDSNRVGAGSHFKCVFNRDPFWLQYLDYPGVIELAEASMGANCHSIGMSAWRSWPGKDSTGELHVPGRIHSDHLFMEYDSELLVSGKVVPPIMICTAHFYLDDIHIDLCPTWAIPGSHKSGQWAQQQPPEKQREWGGRQIEPVLVRAGDVLFFRSEVWHSGSANTSEEVRYLLQVHYGNRMVAQKFSPYLDFRFNHEVVAAATERQLRIMGKHTQSAYD